MVRPNEPVQVLPRLPASHMQNIRAIDAKAPQQWLGTPVRRSGLKHRRIEAKIDDPYTLGRHTKPPDHICPRALRVSQNHVRVMYAPEIRTPHLAPPSRIVIPREE